MTQNKTTALLSLAAALSISGAAQAEGLYGTAMLGLGYQDSASAAYGNNIAVDPDFPAEFSINDSKVGALGIGYDMGNNFRVEGRLGFRNAHFDSQEFGTGARAGEEYVLNGAIKSTTLTVEGFYDIPTGTAFTMPMLTRQRPNSLGMLALVQATRSATKSRCLASTNTLLWATQARAKTASPTDLVLM